MRLRTHALSARIATAALLLLCAACAAETPSLPGTPTLDSAASSTTGSQLPSAIPSVTPIQLPTVIPTSTPRPTATSRPLPSATPDPSLPLSDEPPWRFSVTPDGVAVSNPDGSGQRLLVPYQPLLFEGEAYDIWFAAEVGSDGWAAVRIASVADDHADPRLFVFHLPDLSPVAEFHLLAPELRPMRYNGYDNIAGPEWTDDVPLAVREFSSSGMTWSEAGNRLAFVAAIDGPSADLYLYETSSGDLRRLTDGPNQPKLAGWSPDGRVLLHHEIADLWIGDGSSFTNLGLWAAATDGSGSRRILAAGQPVIVLGWTSPSRFLVTHYDSGARPKPLVGLELIDLDRGRVQTYFDGNLGRAAFDPVDQVAAFAVFEKWGLPTDRLEPGFYLLELANPVPATIELPCPTRPERACLPSSIDWDEELGEFRLGFYDGGRATLSPDGVVTIDTDG